MYSHRWTATLLLMVLFAMQSTASNAQQVAVGGAVIEMVVAPLKNGKPPEDVQCVVKIRLVSGRATYRSSTTGAERQLNDPGTVLCQTPSGEFVMSSSDESLLSFTVGELPSPPTSIPGTGGGPPSTPPPCEFVSPSRPCPPVGRR
jgi:hypothetical protein